MTDDSTSIPTVSDDEIWSLEDRSHDPSGRPVASTTQSTANGDLVVPANPLEDNRSLPAAVARTLLHPALRQLSVGLTAPRAGASSLPSDIVVATDPSADEKRDRDLPVSHRGR